MALFTGGTIQNGTGDDDFMFGGPGSGPNHTISGNGGDDLIIGDHDFVFVGGGGTHASPNTIDDSFAWNTFIDNPDFEPGSPLDSYASIVRTSTSNSSDFYSVLLSQNQTITIDIDYGGSGPGTDVDTVVSIYSSSNSVTPLATNDDDFDDGVDETSFGSEGTPRDSFLTFTPTVGDTYRIEIGQFVSFGQPPGSFDAGQSYIANITVRQHVFDNSTFQFGDDSLSGGPGNDVIYGRSGNDTLDGGSDSDRLVGGPGNDRYFADALDTVVEAPFSSGGGIDTIMISETMTIPQNVEVLRMLEAAGAIGATGGAGPEAMVGNGSVNTINGSGGDDLINAKGGDDVITGGTGADTLVGGFGTDTFIYNAIADSRTGSSQRDTINGFVNFTNENIDLSPIDANPFRAGDQAWKFIGRAAFDGDGSNSPGQLRYIRLDNSVIVEGDWDGDGSANMQIFIIGTNFMTGSDFIL